jgi:hypothetical protein
LFQQVKRLEHKFQRQSCPTIKQRPSVEAAQVQRTSAVKPLVGDGVKKPVTEHLEFSAGGDKERSSAGSIGRFYRVEEQVFSPHR